MYTIAALYHFTSFSDPSALKPDLLALCESLGIRGTLLLACEGINGTVAGRDAAIESLMMHLRKLPGCDALTWKLSYADALPFHRLKIRIKKEIVTMGLPEIDPVKTVGHYVAPEDWNELISDPDTILIDTRNDYECAIGSFRNAIDPETDTFREFPDWFRKFRAARLEEGRPAKIAMFCTGGIRCEKASAFLKSEGIEDVYHLKGGILKYLETVPEAESLWDGACFVFDHRVAVEHGLKPGNFSLCHGCRKPLSDVDRQSEDYLEGVSCPHCASSRNEEQRARYAARQQQMTRAKARGEIHLGHPAPADTPETHDKSILRESER